MVKYYFKFVIEIHRKSLTGHKPAVIDNPNLSKIKKNIFFTVGQTQILFRRKFHLQFISLTNKQIKEKKRQK